MHRKPRGRWCGRQRRYLVASDEYRVGRVRSGAIGYAHRVERWLWRQNCQTRSNTVVTSRIRARACRCWPSTTTASCRRTRRTTTGSGMRASSVAASFSSTGLTAPRASWRPSPRSLTRSCGSATHAPPRQRRPARSRLGLQARQQRCYRQHQSRALLYEGVRHREGKRSASHFKWYAVRQVLPDGPLGRATISGGASRASITHHDYYHRRRSVPARAVDQAEDDKSA